MKDYFKEQINGGATDNFFYGTESNGEVRIERHRGTLDTLPTNLRFNKMIGATPFFTLEESSGVEE